MQYLKQKRGIWHFRIVIPEDVRAVLKSGKEIMRSLQTSSKREASAKVGTHIQEWTIKIEQARKSNGRDTILISNDLRIRKSEDGFDLETTKGVQVKKRPLQIGFIAELANVWFKMHWSDFFGSIDRSNLAELELKERLPHSDVRQSINDFYEEHRSLLPSKTKFIMHSLNVLNAEIKYDKNKIHPPILYPDEFFAPTPSISPIIKSETLFDGTRISDAVEEYFNRINEKPEKTKLLFKARVALFVDYLGHNARLSEITKEMADQFRHELKKYPSRKPKTIKGIKEAQLWAEQSKAPLLKSGAINAYTDAIRAVLMPSSKRLNIPNPFSNLEIARDKSAGSTKYKDFTSEDIKLIFSESYCLHRKNFKSRPSDFWVMLALLFHGSRINEWAQARPQQFFVEDGIFSFEISGQTKTDSSERKIPIHPVLLQLGFKEFCLKSKTERLFPDLKETEKGQFSAGLSKRLNKYIDLCGIDDPKKVVHSFRHTWITKSRFVDMPEEERNYMAGHKNTGQGSKYGSFPMQKLFNQISKINYPIDVNQLSKIRDTIPGCS